MLWSTNIKLSYSEKEIQIYKDNFKKNSVKYWPKLHVSAVKSFKYQNKESVHFVV